MVAVYTAEGLAKKNASDKDRSTSYLLNVAVAGAIFGVTVLVGTGLAAIVPRWTDDLLRGAVLLTAYITGKYFIAPAFEQVGIVPRT